MLLKSHVAAPEMKSDNVVRLYPEALFRARSALADRMVARDDSIKAAERCEEENRDAAENSGPSTEWTSTWQWDPAPEHISSRLCQQALTIWRGVATVDGMHAPLAKHFDIGAFWSLVGHLDFLEPVKDGRDFRFRVHGAEGARSMGGEMTGRLLSRAVLPSKPLDFILAGNMAVSRRPAPLYTRHVAVLEARPLLMTRVTLPFLGEDGTVTRLLVASRTHDIGDAVLARHAGDACRV